MSSRCASLRHCHDTFCPGGVVQAAEAGIRVCPACRYSPARIAMCIARSLLGGSQQELSRGAGAMGSHPKASAPSFRALRGPAGSCLDSWCHQARIAIQSRISNTSSAAIRPCSMPLMQSCWWHAGSPCHQAAAGKREDCPQSRHVRPRSSLCKQMQGYSAWPQQRMHELVAAIYAACNHPSLSMLRRSLMLTGARLAAPYPLL